MDGYLFDPTEYTDERLRRIMLNNTCRHCGNRLDKMNRGRYDSYCKVTPSRRTKNGYLKVKVNQPACILFTHKALTQ